MSNSLKVILAILGVVGVGFLIYYLSQPKQTQKPANQTGSGNTLNLSFGTPASSESGTIPSDFGFTGTNANGDQVVNGLTRNQYLALGYSEADVNMLFA